MKKAWVAAVLFISAAGPVYSNDAQVEEYARMAAAGANEFFKKSPPSDGVTVSSRAYSAGKAVVYEYVLAIRSNVTDAELAIWRSGTRSEVVPAACSMLKRDPFFKKGLYFRYIYLSRRGEVLDDFVVNRPACSGL